MNLPFPDNRFGQVTALEVLEHMPQWKIGLGEIIRVASKKVVITVPYNEKPICEICPNCKSISYLEGHINRFTDKDFKSIDIKGKITFHKIKYTSSFNYQIKWRGLLRSSNKISYLKNIKINTKIPKTVCPSCHKGAPYKKYAKRFIRRLIRTLTNSPEYLLVSIDLTD
jgi:ubiquinone/menaquinone biosynthesis C-methylase UbiE